MVTRSSHLIFFERKSGTGRWPEPVCMCTCLDCMALAWFCGVMFCTLVVSTLTLLWRGFAIKFKSNFFGKTWNFLVLFCPAINIYCSTAAHRKLHFFEWATKPVASALKKKIWPFERESRFQIHSLKVALSYRAFLLSCILSSYLYQNHTTTGSGA